MTDQFQNGAERRKYNRCSGLLVEYSLYSKGGVEAFKKSALTKDISLEGICVYINEPLDIGTIVYINIFFFMTNKPVKVKAEVMWQSKEGDEEEGVLACYVVGFEFKEVREAGRPILVEQIEEAERKAVREFGGTS